MFRHHDRYAITLFAECGYRFRTIKKINNNLALTGFYLCFIGSSKARSTRELLVRLLGWHHDAPCVVLFRVELHLKMSPIVYEFSDTSTAASCVGEYPHRYMYMYLSIYYLLWSHELL